MRLSDSFARAAVRSVIPFRTEHDIEPSPGHRFRVRPVTRGDDGALRQLLEHLSPEDVRFRFLMSLRLFSDQVVHPLTRLANVHRLGLVASLEGAADGAIVAHAILAPDADGRGAEFAVLVQANQRRWGLGRHLLECLITHARALGVRQVYGVVLRNNARMRELAGEMGFRESTHWEERGCLLVALELVSARA